MLAVGCSPWERRRLAGNVGPPIPPLPFDVQCSTFDVRRSTFDVRYFPPRGAKRFTRPSPISRTPDPKSLSEKSFPGSTGGPPVPSGGSPTGAGESLAPPIFQTDPNLGPADFARPTPASASHACRFASSSHSYAPTIPAPCGYQYLFSRHCVANECLNVCGVTFLVRPARAAASFTARCNVSSFK